MTVWEAIKKDWIIKKSEITEMGINPNKQWGEITLDELQLLSNYLDVLIGDIVD